MRLSMIALVEIMETGAPFTFSVYSNTERVTSHAASMRPGGSLNADPRQV